MATLESMTVRLGIDTDHLRAGADRAKGVLSGLGKAVAGLGVGVPAVAAVATGVGGMAAAFASAGLAAKAFQLAVGPQMADVADAAQLAEEAEKAAASGAEDAAEKQKAYTDALAAMPPHTRAMAQEFVGLQKDYRGWSDAMSSTTMPVFTRALQVVRRLLPLLTPFVEAASQAFGQFVDEIDRATQGKGLQTFANSLATIAGQNLKDFLTGLKNIAVGIGGIIKAFMPFSTTMSGGFADATEAFAKWGQGLSDSQGFADFITLAKQGAQTLATLGQAALKLIVALSPLIGVTATIALALAKMINALPPEVMAGLATAILSAVIAFKAFKLAADAVDTVTDLMNSRLGQVARRWVSTAATSIKSGVRMAASAVTNAARVAAAWVGAAARATGTFLKAMIRVAAQVIMQFVRMAARAVIWAATMAAQWIIAMGPVGWIIAAVIALVALIILNWDKVKAWTLAIWDWVWKKIQTAIGYIMAAVDWLKALPGKIGTWFGQAKDLAVGKFTALVAWVKGLPGRISSALSTLSARLKERATSALAAFREAVVSRAQSAISWVKGLPGRISRAIGSMGKLLYDKGRDVIAGLWNGISGMGGWLWDKVKSFVSTNVVGAAKSFLHIGSPSKLMASAIGRWIPAGIAVGAEDEAPAMNKAIAGLVDVPGLAGVHAAAQTQAATPAWRIELVGPQDMLRLIRRISQTTSRGGSADGVFSV